MGREVVLVVDMLVGFLEPGHVLYCGDEARRIIPEVVGLLERKRREGAEIIFIADNHDPEDLEFKMFPPHCLAGSEESKVIPELRGFAGRYIPKKRYSAFFGTDLEKILARERPEKVTVVGVCTDICVMHTVADLRNRDYIVEVPGNCVASFDPEAHECALKHMRKILGAAVV